MFNVDKNQLSRQTGNREKNISTAKKRDIAPFKVNGQSHIILQQLSCGTRSKVSYVPNQAQISLKHSSQLTNKTTLPAQLRIYDRKCWPALKITK
jgi:predicted ATP-binding protein involved in virulence